MSPAVTIFAHRSHRQMAAVARGVSAAVVFGTVLASVSLAHAAPSRSPLKPLAEAQAVAPASDALADRRADRGKQTPTMPRTNDSRRGGKGEGVIVGAQTEK